MSLYVEPIGGSRSLPATGPEPDVVIVIHDPAEGRTEPQLSTPRDDFAEVWRELMGKALDDADPLT